MADPSVKKVQNALKMQGFNVAETDLESYLALSRLRLHEAPGFKVGSLKQRHRVFLFELSQENVYNYTNSKARSSDPAWPLIGGAHHEKISLDSKYPISVGFQLFCG
jgi:hypothetical protein